MTKSWFFIDNNGTFQLPNPHNTSYLYLPMINAAGMVSSITPTLSGDLKTDQNTFLLLPTAVEDLHNSRSTRNFWLRVNREAIWSVTGNSAQQIAAKFSPVEEEVLLTAGFLWHKVTRKNNALKLKAEVTNFVPSGEDTVELMQVTITNIGEETVTFTPTAAIPIYGRSADNLRDHRHVTSLLHRIKCTENGVVVQPALSFDERGHTHNKTVYAVFGVEADGKNPQGFYPDVESFIGEGGTLDWPETVVSPGTKPYLAGTVVKGYEAMGGIQFDEVILQPKEEKSFILILSISQGEADFEGLLARYGSDVGFSSELAKTKKYWLEKLSTLQFETGAPQFDNWLKWVTLQPILRRQIGNSFLPYHDYGRGGRGWRDLWQDILALLFMDYQDVGDALLGHFAGVRMDGSNATIIGNSLGEFKADRNDIPRVWMDHGVWPLLTTHLYINQSGNLEFLLREQTYFKDRLCFRARGRDDQWNPEQGTVVRTEQGDVYRGSVLEHILVQHLTAFFNVGEHNNILLEDADWNDALDMANEKGESVAFSAFYAGNLRIMGGLCMALAEKGVPRISLSSELLQLTDTLSSPVDYQSVSEKSERLRGYFEQTSHRISGVKVEVSPAALAQDLFAKADWLAGHIQAQEWIENGNNNGWFNSYYDNHGEPVGGKFGSATRMMLTGQVFTLMFGIASDEQAGKIVQSADKYLYDQSVGGYRLNTDFGEDFSGLGRAFGFAYGHKENGAMFSHMAMMYANALYKRELVAAGWKVVKSIYDHSLEFAVSRMYPGIPEYFSQRGRGMYPYLTGSASWFLLTMLTEVYGVKGKLGNLVLEPKLMPEQFNSEGQTSVQTLFAGKKITVCYKNPDRLPYGEYRVVRVDVNRQPLIMEGKEQFALISIKQLESLPNEIEFDVFLENLHD